MKAENGKTSIFRIGLLIAAAFLLFGVLSGLRASTGILTSAFSEWTGLSYGTVSTAFTVMNLVLAFSGPVFGILTLKFSPAKIMIAGAILGGAGFIGAAFSTTLAALIICMGILFGLGASALCYSIVYAAAVPVVGQKYSIVLGGIISASQGFISMFFAPLFTYGTDVFGIQTCLIITGIISLCLIPLCFLFMPRKSARPAVVEKTEREPLRKVLKESAPLLFLLMMFLAMFTYGMCDGLMINHLQTIVETRGLSEDFATLTVSVYSCACMVGALAGGVICNHLRNRRLLFASIYLTWCIVFLISSLVPVNQVLGMILITFSGLGMGMTLPTLSAIATEVIPIEKFAAVYSLIYFFMIIAYAIMSWLGGFVYDMRGTFIPAGIIATVLASVIVVIFTISGLRQRKALKKSEN